MKHRTDRFDAISEWLGVGIDETQRTALLRYELWLEEEAMPAGGIGPAEGDRLFDRHIADSMAFLPGIPQDARTVVDIGGGVGLPSIPLAIIQPDLEFALVDRSLRRTDLATRAIRILGLTNVSVLTEDAYALEPTYDVALFRASLPIGQAVEALRYCLRRSGTGLLAVSRQFEEPAIPSEPEGITFTLSREGDRALASPFWLLKMRFKE